MRQREASPIAVIGAGVVGLSTAVRQLERGLAVTIHAEHRSPRIASAVAPAMFTPFPGSDVARSRLWAQTSLEALRALEHREGPTAGVRFGPFREYCYRQPGPRPFADLSSQRAVPVMPQGFAAVLDSDRPHIDTNRHLAWLESRFVLLGGRMVEEQLTSIDTLFETRSRDRCQLRGCRRSHARPRSAGSGDARDCCPYATNSWTCTQPSRRRAVQHRGVCVHL